MKKLILLFLILGTGFLFPPQASATVSPQMAAGSSHTVGVKSDGTVVAVGYNWYGQLNVDSWTDIVQVAAFLARAFLSF